MNSCVENDIADVSFEDSPQEALFVDAAKKLALAIDASRMASAIPPVKAAGFVCEIKQLGIAEFLTDGDEAADNPARVLFLIAEALATADVEVAWRGLIDLPATLLRTCLSEVSAENSIDALAFPYGRNDIADGSEWVLFWPHGELPARTCLWSPVHNGLLRYGAEAFTSSRTTADDSHRLLGFSDASATRIDVSTDCEKFEQLPITSDQRTFIKAHLLALLGGLLSGAIQRLVIEAYAYAAMRESFGKPISQHQAVAVRLADIALNRDTTRLCLLDTLQFPHWQDDARLTVVARYLSETVCDIARDTVQIAAAHGYVEGLPFKRLFEQTRTLSTILSIAIG